MSDQPTAEIDMDVSLALGPVQEQLEALAATVAPASEEIGTQLQSLWEGGAEESALTVISNNAAQLVHVITTMNTAATMAQNVALKAAEQRDRAVGALKGLRADVETMNTDNDLVQGLVDMVCENEQEYWWEFADENRLESLIDTTPLTIDQCRFLDAIIFSGWLPSESPRWTELADWLRSVQNDLRAKSTYIASLDLSGEE